MAADLTQTSSPLNPVLLQNLNKLRIPEPSAEQLRLARWVSRKQSTIVTGPAGCGKTLGAIVAVLNEMTRQNLNTRSTSFLINVCRNADLIILRELIRTLTYGLPKLTCSALSRASDNFAENALRATSNTTIIVATVPATRDAINRGYLTRDRIKWFLVDDTDVLFKEHATRDFPLKFKALWLNEEDKMLTPHPVTLLIGKRWDPKAWHLATNIIASVKPLLFPRRVRKTVEVDLVEQGKLSSEILGRINALKSVTCSITHRLPKPSVIIFQTISDMAIQSKYLDSNNVTFGVLDPNASDEERNSVLDKFERGSISVLLSVGSVHDLCIRGEQEIIVCGLPYQKNNRDVLDIVYCARQLQMGANVLNSIKATILLSPNTKMRTFRETLVAIVQNQLNSGYEHFSAHELLLTMKLVNSRTGAEISQSKDVSDLFAQGTGGDLSRKRAASPTGLVSRGPKRTSLGFERMPRNKKSARHQRSISLPTSEDSMPESPQSKYTSGFARAAPAGSVGNSYFQAEPQIAESYLQKAMSRPTSPIRFRPAAARPRSELFSDQPLRPASQQSVSQTSRPLSTAGPSSDSVPNTMQGYIQGKVLQ